MVLVIVTERMHEGGIEFLRENGVDVELLYETNRSLEDAIAVADGIVVRLAKVTESLLRIGKESKLKVVAKHGTGVDNIDVEAARKLGIRVVYTPGVMANAVAEFTLGAIFLLAKNYAQYDSEVRKGSWKTRYRASNLEIRGKTIGIIGYGHIGKEVARLANCLGANVVAYDPYVATCEPYAKQLDLEALLRSSDFVSIHIPLNEDTYHMIGEDQFKIMRDGACLVNSARGGIVDEAALCKAIEEGKISGAVLDTTEHEPIALGDPILKCQNVILTAHTAGISDVAQVTESMLACTQLLDVLRGEEPAHFLV